MGSFSHNLLIHALQHPCWVGNTACFVACRQAADGGDADAVAHLGHMYANGVGVDQNNETARQLFQAAADAGNPIGQFGLGYMHLTGHGMEQNHRAAFKLFQRASEAVSMSRHVNVCALKHVPSMVEATI